MIRRDRAGDVCRGNAHDYVGSHRDDGDGNEVRRADRRGHVHVDGAHHEHAYVRGRVIHACAYARASP